MPVHSVALLNANWLWATHSTRLSAVDAGSKAMPMSSRKPPFAVWIVPMLCSGPSVPSALMAKRLISPALVPAYSLPSGPMTTPV